MARAFGSGPDPVGSGRSTPALTLHRKQNRSYQDLALEARKNYRVVEEEAIHLGHSFTGTLAWLVPVARQSVRIT